MDTTPAVDHHPPWARFAGAGDGVWREARRRGSPRARGRARAVAHAAVDPFALWIAIIASVGPAGPDQLASLARRVARRLYRRAAAHAGGAASALLPYARRVALLDAAWRTGDPGDGCVPLDTSPDTEADALEAALRLPPRRAALAASPSPPPRRPPALAPDPPATTAVPDDAA